MKTLLVILMLVTQCAYAQDAGYAPRVGKADVLYAAGAYKEAADIYADAFHRPDEQSTAYDHYKCARSWARARYADSAFAELFYIARQRHYRSYAYALQDTNLRSLHTDARWQQWLGLVQQNKERAEAVPDKSLLAALADILKTDQQYRQQVDDVEKQYGRESKEIKQLWELMRQQDAVNLVKVTNILDVWGWLGSDKIGAAGNVTLFLVIQHADLKTQEQYLPMMRDAVKEGRAHADDLALLEDRVALRQGRRQLYGSQIGRNPETGAYYISPLEDPDHVDTRRAEVGLPALAAYISHWGLTWDVVQYKKDLPRLEQMEKQLRSK
jgi:hypothetical protein